ncbi:MAG: gamma carbonic anhydrase family protein [Candidatus Pacebacteria bacterium]|nr:gamma carbonic anhydrase family protein [Candidatus Paceibacterota bacterium]
MTGLPPGNIYPFRGIVPQIATTSFIAPTAVVAGDVTIGENSSLWFGAIVRGDVNFIRIGNRSNLQDNSVVHCTKDGNPTLIGDDVTIGHSAIIHACTLADACFIGMGAIILDGAIVQSRAMVAAGSLVTGGKIIASGELWAGNPAKKLRDLSDSERENLHQIAARYVEYAGYYRRGD